jgi:hypothetical protein
MGFIKKKIRDRLQLSLKDVLRAVTGAETFALRGLLNMQEIIPDGYHPLRKTKVKNQIAATVPAVVNNFVF